MVIPGSKVRRGDVLITVCPPLNGGNSWTDLQLSYQKSKADFERADRLLEKNAISDREYQEIKRIYLINKSGYEAFLNLTQGKSILSSEIENNHLAIKSQIDGTVAEVMAKTGQHVSVGEKLMTVLDPSVIWIQMNIYEKDYYRIGEPQGASILLPGIDNPIILEKKQWLVLSRGELVDLQSRTIPFLVEIKNPDRIFKVGQILQVELYTSQEKEVMCIPETAVFDEDIQKVVYVQTGGESFEKRVVETGTIYKGWIEIENGIEWKDHIVTEGGYMIKLASTMSDVGHPHVH
jgi:RND family efflux transporter MFP subunit